MATLAVETSCSLVGSACFQWHQGYEGFPGISRYAVIRISHSVLMKDADFSENVAAPQSDIDALSPPALV
jgi:hypothetical protein